MEKRTDSKWIKRHVWAVGALVLALGGCGSSGTGVPPGTGDMAMAGAADMAVSAGDMAMSASGAVTGTVGGMPFNTSATALWIGSPDDPQTTVVYVFDKAVKCSDLKTMGWDKRIPDGTQVLEMKMFGTAPATFKITTSMTPAPGEAAVNYTLSSQAGTPKETLGSSGNIVLTTRTAMMSATGTFMIDFGGGDTLKGSYNAPYCPGGHEP